MNKNKSTKIITMVALIVGIISVSLGFAAFSATLTISSRATVTPNDDQFSIAVYGVEELSDDFNYLVPSFYTSSTSSVAFLNNQETVKATIASISSLNNGKQINLSNLSAEFTSAPYWVDYYFMLKNDGEYDAYFNFSEYEKYFTEGFDKICTPVTGTSADLVSEACNNVDISYLFYNSQGDILTAMESFDISKSYKFAKNDFLIFRVSIYYTNYYSDVLADGPFDVEFEDIQIMFKSAPVGELMNP